MLINTIAASKEKGIAMENIEYVILIGFFRTLME